MTKVPCVINMLDGWAEFFDGRNKGCAEQTWLDDETIVLGSSLALALQLDDALVTKRS